jgi:hypothetical protein
MKYHHSSVSMNSKKTRKCKGTKRMNRLKGGGRFGKALKSLGRALGFSNSAEERETQLRVPITAARQEEVISPFSSLQLEVPRIEAARREEVERAAQAEREEKAAQAAQAAREEKAARAVEAARVAEAARTRATYSIRISGAKGSTAEYINGLYDVTDKVSGGMPLYKKQGFRVTLEYHTFNRCWVLTDNTNKSQRSYTTLAYVECPFGLLPDQAPAGIWYVINTNDDSDDEYSEDDNYSEDDYHSEDDNYSQDDYYHEKQPNIVVSRIDAGGTRKRTIKRKKRY